MNNFIFGAMTTKYVESFPEDIFESDKIRAIIDYQFEKKTKWYFELQLMWFGLIYLIPIFIVIFGNPSRTVLLIAINISCLGELGMYLIEVMAMKVEGLRSYFSNHWNYIDQLNLILFQAFYVTALINSDKPETDEKELPSYLKLIYGSIIFISWFKLTWF